MMTARKKMIVLARNPTDEHRVCAVGHVFTRKSVERLQAQLRDAGWQPYDAIELHSVADFEAGRTS